MQNPVSRQELFDFLDKHNIAHTSMDHRPVFTVEEGEDIKAKLPGGHSKNLFLKDKKGKLFLLSALAQTSIRLNRLHGVLGCARLSFGKEDLMVETLGVTPGSVTAFSLLNDRHDQLVTFVLDAALLAHEKVYFHPLKNDATTCISSKDLLAFANASGHLPLIVNFAVAAGADPALVS